MDGSTKKLHPMKYDRILFIVIIICSIYAVVVSTWKFWLICEILLFFVLVISFSNGLRDLLNIHSVAISLIFLYSLPSTISILQGKIVLMENELLMLFSSLFIGFAGYTLGALYFKRLFISENKYNARFSQKINSLFWLAYKYRYVLVLILCIVLFHWGFMIRGMSYRESILYRMETQGTMQYIKLLIPTVFSALMIAMITIIGDLKKNKKLSLLSYLLIILVVLSIIGGHRIWIIGLFICLLLSFQSYLKRRHMILIIISVIFMSIILSGGIRYARVGYSFLENIKRFYNYFSDVAKQMTFRDLMWEWSIFNTPFSTFITLIENIPKNISFDYSAYVKDLSLLVPTVIYRNRPLPYNQWYVSVFNPELFQIGGGKTFFVVGFGHLFAGRLGVLIHLFLFGFLFDGIYKYFKKIGGAAGLFLYSYFFIQLFNFAVGYGFIAFIKTSIIMNFIIPISLLFLFILILDLVNPRKLLMRTT